MKNHSWKNLWALCAVAAALPVAWAAEPAKPTAPAEKSGPEVSVTPVVTFVNVQGNENKFREDWWMNDGWTGGIEEFTLKDKIGKDTLFNLEGRGIFDQHDYKLGIEIIKPDFWFLRAGFSEYSKYFNDRGGFFSSFSQTHFDLNKELRLDIGKIYVDLGLTLKNWPKITFGYEHDFKEGSKSMVEWGTVSEAGVSKKIFPAFKDIDERVDIFKLNIEHDLGPVHLGDEFRYESYRNDTKRLDDAQVVIGASEKNVTVKEDFSHDLLSNVFHMESHVNEKMFWSLGYLFTTLQGDGSVNINTTGIPTAGIDKFWMTQDVDLNNESHVMNANFMVGPFDGLVGYAGIQIEKTDADGFTDASLTTRADLPGLGPNALIRTSSDRNSLEESAGVRYTKIPFTTLYAEARLRQEKIDLFEREVVDGSLSTAPAFLRDTATDVEREEYTVGFNTSPLRRITWSGRYRHSNRDNQYDHKRDTTTGVDSAYSAFITEQEFASDELMTKVTLRPMSRLAVALQYQYVKSVIDTATDPITDVTPGGKLRASEYQAQIYTISVTATPLNRLYVTGLLSYQDTRTAAFANDSLAIIPFRGNVYSVVGSAGYVIDNKTDVTGSYIFSKAVNFSNNSSDGLPLGTDNERHGLSLSLTRRINDNMVARLRYGFYQFRDPSNGGIDNYTAHLASLSWTIRF